MTKLNSQRGFTLIELMMVVVLTIPFFLLLGTYTTMTHESTEVIEGTIATDEQAQHLTALINHELRQAYSDSVQISDGEITYTLPWDTNGNGLALDDTFAPQASARRRIGTGNSPDQITLTTENQTRIIAHDLDFENNPLTFTRLHNGDIAITFATTQRTRRGHAITTPQESVVYPRN